MERYDVLIVGGGISGLSLAHHCARKGLETVVLEAEAEAGGALQSEQFGERFWLELGAHTAYNSYGGMLEMVEALGLEQGLLPRRKLPYFLWEGDRPVSIARRLHYWELAISLPRLWKARRDALSVSQYYSAILGRRNYRDVVGPMLNAVPSQEAGGFPAEMLFKSRARRKEIPRSFSLQSGLQSLPRAMAAEERVTVLTGQRAKALKRAKGEFTTTTVSGTTIQSALVALATDPQQAAELSAGVSGELPALLAQIAVKSTISVGVVLKKEASRLPPLAGMVAREAPFFSVVSRDLIDDPEYRGFVFHFKPETTEAARRDCIEQVLGVRMPAIAHLASKTNRLPSPTVGHRERVAAMERHLAGERVLLTGNYFGGLALEDCVQRSIAEAARAVKVYSGR